ncbi:PB1 domain [Dillenia turbinata]|uniref:PB1 domain n=1 Tax=Dillenia turbinata TaxID=194707 RepID=A0AAN8UIK4_9MAGN
MEYENNPPWEEQQPPANYKVKFMCSYGGKVQPRPHDHQLSYVGGETKILAVDRTIKFSSLTNKLNQLCESEVCFKYQLPGEDLDALISVTNDDDLEHMMHEYDRMYRVSPKPARLRLFLFPINPPPVQPGFGSDEIKSDRDRFVEALNSAPVQPVQPAPIRQNHMDFLFGLEKTGSPPPKIQDPNPDVGTRVETLSENSNRAIGPDPGLTQMDIQRHIQDLQRLQIASEQQHMNRRKSDDNLVSGFSGDQNQYYIPKLPEKVTHPPLAASGPPVSAAYWPEKHYPVSSPDQPVYMIQAPANMYHAPTMVRPMTGQTGYFPVQRMGPPDVYREQQVYNVVSPATAVTAATMSPAPQTLQQAPQTLPPQPQKVAGYPAVADAGYAQVGYDSNGRQVYYTASAGVGVVPPYTAVAATAVGSDGKVAAMKILLK